MAFGTAETPYVRILIVVYKCLAAEWAETPLARFVKLFCCTLIFLHVVVVYILILLIGTAKTGNVRVVRIEYKIALIGLQEFAYL